MLLKDKTLADELKKNGYIVINFLDPGELAAINEFYSMHHHGQDPPNFNEDIHMTTWCSDSDYKSSVADGMKSRFAEASERFFENYRRLNHVFIAKKSGAQTTFKVHQDWNVVDETKYESVNVWVPLHDVDERSGALWVLKGSHNSNRKVRGAGYLFPEYGPYFQKLEKAAVSVSLKAGQAIVFYHSVIHGSPPNVSGKNRIAACFSVIPEKAPLCIYFQKQENDALQQHEPADDFVYAYHNLRAESVSKPPTPTPAFLHNPYRNKKVTEKEIDAVITPKKSFLAALFGR